MDGPRKQPQSDLRLPTELLLEILALATAGGPAQSARSPPTQQQLAMLVTLAPVCPLFQDFSRSNLLRYSTVGDQRQAEGLLSFLKGDASQSRGVQRLAVRAPRRGAEAVRAEQVVHLLQECTELVEVNIQQLLDEREEYSEGGEFPVQQVADYLVSLLIFPNYVGKWLPSSSSHSLPAPHRPKVHLTRLRHLSIHTHLAPELSPILDPAYLPFLQSLSLARFTYTYPLSQLTPQLIAIRSAHFSPQLNFPSVRACCYTGSLSSTSYNLPGSTEVLFLPTLPKNSSVPWLASTIASADRLAEVHMLKLGEQGDSVRLVCRKRGVKLVEIDLGEVGEWEVDGEMYWQGLVEKII